MKKKIILPTDFSDNARNAYHYAFSLFGFENVEYILFNTYLLPYTRMGTLINLIEIIEEISKKGLEDELIHCQETYQNTNIDIKVKSAYGEFADELNDLAKNENADFVVLGTKGASGIEKVLVGSNTARVIRKVNCPTIAVPTEAENKKPKRIAFASDLESVQDTTLKPLLDIAFRSASKLLIFNIDKEGDADDFVSVTNETYEHPALQGISQSYTTIREDDIIVGIEDFVEEHDIDLLAMVARQHNFFERIFHTSITKEMAMELDDVPLLILHE